MLAFMLLVVWLAAGGSALLWGLEYYLLPLDARAFSPLARLFAPTGVIGHGLGVVGTAMIVVGVAGYTARKRSPWLRRVGKLKHWLQVHIFLCTLGPFFVLLHTTFKFGGLISVAFWAMTVVVLSGVFGRYVYVHIPKTLNGRFLDLEAIRERTRRILDRIRSEAGLSEAALAEVVGGASGELTVPRGLGHALFLAVRTDVAGRLRHRKVRRRLRDHGVAPGLREPLAGLIRERSRLERQTVLLRPFQRLFRYWHVVHLPLAVVMFVILGVHVAVAVLFGYTWVF